MDEIRQKNLHKPEMTDSDGLHGVFFGDFDGDHYADLFLPGPYGGHRLYRNKGSFQFEDVTEKTGLSDLFNSHWAAGGTFVDFDGDGDLDIFVAGSGERNLMLENQGDGTFKDKAKEVGLDVESVNIQMAFADYDQDGDLDGYLVTNSMKGSPKLPNNTEVKVAIKGGKPEVEKKYQGIAGIVPHPSEGYRIVPAGDRDYLFRNDGGVFTDVSTEAGIEGFHEGLSAIWFDADEDGDPDLYVSNDFFGPDRFYMNHKGKFVESVKVAMPHTPWFSMGATCGDINNDGLFDLFTTDMAGSNHYKSKMGMGDMEKSSWFLTTSDPPQYMRNALFINTGTPRFLEAAHFAGIAGSDWTWSSQFADLDNDGLVDLFVTNGTTHDSTNSDLVAQANLIQDPLAQANFWRNQGLKKDTNYAYRNLGGLKFQKISEEWGLDYLGVSFGAAFADLDLDGDLDLAITSLGDPIRIYRNDSQEGNSMRIRLHGKGLNSHAIGAKVTMETEAGKLIARYLSPVQGYASSNEPILHFGMGDARKAKKLTVRWPTGELQVHRDIPANVALDIYQDESLYWKKPPKPREPPIFLETQIFSGFRHVENEFNDYSIQPLLPHRLSRLGPGIALADVDTDGDTDIFMGAASKQQGTILIKEDGNRFLPSEQVPLKSFYLGEDMGAVFFDVENDGDPDLFVASGGADPNLRTVFRRDRLHINDGKGNFALAPAATENHRDSSGPVAPVDFDLDGDIDLFVGGRLVPGQYPLTPVSRLLVNEGGRLVDRALSLAKGLSNSGMVTGAIWSDIDNDGWPDLLTTHEWGPIRVWKNTEGKLAEVSLASGTVDLLGWWTGISGADIDNDGDIDFAVGNLGLNTKYHATPKHPWLAYYGKFNDMDTPRFIEASYEGDILFPVRGKSCSTAAIPGLSTKFHTFHEFAGATLNQVYANAQLSNAKSFSINTLASGLLFNDGTGKFTFRPLPWQAQISSVFGTLFADVDADGFQDLCLVQNFYSTQPETGNVDGGIGLVLKGKPSGEFEPLGARDSGFVLPGDAKALVAIDLNSDDRPDMIATRNNHSPITFQNICIQGKPFSVKFYGNQGICAKIRLELSSGNYLYGEYHTSSGYLSSGENTLFFGIPINTRPVALFYTPIGSIEKRIPIAKLSKKSTITIQ